MISRGCPTFFDGSSVCLLPLHNDLQIFQVVTQLLHLGLVKLLRRLELLQTRQQSSDARPDAHLTFSIKNPVPTSTMTVSASESSPRTYSELVNGTSTELAPTASQLSLPIFYCSTTARIPGGAAARACTQRRHSLNLFWAPWSWAKDEVKCSSSSSSCFLTCASCSGARVSRLTGKMVRNVFERM